MQTPSLIAFVVLLAPALPAQWSYVPSGTTAELRGLTARGPVIWASGMRGTVLRSVDGGRGWTADTVAGAASLDLRSIAARDTGWAMTASAGDAERGLAKVFATSDGGRRWRLVLDATTPGAFFDAIALDDGGRAVLVSDPVNGRFHVLLSADSGRSWRAAAGVPPALPGEAAFAASGSSLVTWADGLAWIGSGGGGRARVFHSRDGGESWDVADTPVHAAGPAAGIFSLATCDGRRLIAVGGDYSQPRLSATSVALSEDRGRTWRAAARPPAAYLSSVACADGGRLMVAVGLAGTFVSRDAGDSWTQTDTIPLNAVRSTGRGFVAVGPRGRAAYIDSLP